MPQIKTHGIKTDDFDRVLYDNQSVFVYEESEKSLNSDNDSWEEIINLNVTISADQPYGVMQYANIDIITAAHANNQSWSAGGLLLRLNFEGETSLSIRQKPYEYNWMNMYVQHFWIISSPGNYTFKVEWAFHDDGYPTNIRNIKNAVILLKN